MKSFFLTVYQNQGFVEVDALHDAQVRWTLEGQLDAFPPEDVQELDVFRRHLASPKSCHKLSEKEEWSCWIMGIRL